MRVFGLIGKNINYSFSEKFFNKKFEKEFIKNATYKLFDIENIHIIKKLFVDIKNLHGLNVTIPYKQEIIPLLTDLSQEAKQIKAVNTIKIIDCKYIGYNTDIYGFEQSFFKKLRLYHKKALILGTGGSSKAVIFVLNKLNMPYVCISRKQSINTLSYEDITSVFLKTYQIIINCTPIGTYPNIHECPLIPYEALSTKHYLYDLVYNPFETLFLKKGKEQGCTTQNGLDMLHIQANKSWEIWNS